MNIKEVAEQRVQEIVKEIKYYVSEGMNKEVAVKIAKNSTTIGPKYWEMVTNQI